MLRREAIQRHRINRAVNFVQANIAEPIGLDRIADVACLSKYHFVRTFQDYFHEPPCRFMKRIRLEQAARALIFLRDKPITTVAFECGFSSSQAFSNAFSSRFRTTPRQFRSASQIRIKKPPAAETPLLLHPILDGEEGERAVPAPQITRRPARRVAYIRHLGPYQGPGITMAFTALERWARDRGCWHGQSECIGLCPDNAALTPSGSCRYDACLPVPDGVEEDETIGIQTIPAGRYVVLRTVCATHNMNALWDWVCFRWLPASGEVYDLQHSYEAYPIHDGLAAGPETGVDLCIRLRPKGPRFRVTG